MVIKVKQIALFCAAATLPVSAMADDAMADQAFASLMQRGAVARHFGQVGWDLCQSAAQLH
ncbi:MAG: hypothetical protein CM15mP84_03230 [Cellvibrionales bacterium]|nr:MAG: hypothetical protein CM15mP84_03230 [Cellvibrionales bacterium]